MYVCIYMYVDLSLSLNIPGLRVNPNPLTRPLIAEVELASPGRGCDNREHVYHIRMLPVKREWRRKRLGILGQI